MTLFDRCKEEIARKHGHGDWRTLQYRLADLDDYYREAAELYAVKKVDQLRVYIAGACDDESIAHLINMA